MAQLFKELSCPFIKSAFYYRAIIIISTTWYSTILPMDGLGTRRLEVLKGHLHGQGDVKPSECSAVKSSAPMSSTKAEVQRAFPRHRYIWAISMHVITRAGVCVCVVRVCSVTCVLRSSSTTLISEHLCTDHVISIALIGCVYVFT